MKKTIFLNGLLLIFMINSYDKVCQEMRPNIRYAHPFNGKKIDYQFSLGIKEENSYPTICFVHLSDEDKKILWQKLSNMKDKIVDKELQESFSSDSVVAKVLSDFKEMRKYGTKKDAFSLKKLTVGDVLEKLELYRTTP
ncbi:MAG: hypothetical protein ACOYT8_02330 [Candidatus Dependentiae bacterium]